jgi:hypothetical protein
MNPGIRAVMLAKGRMYGLWSRARPSASNRSATPTTPINDAKMIASLRFGITVSLVIV